MHIVIIGGGRIGKFLGQRMLASEHTVVIIEKEQEVAHQLAQDIPNALIILGNGCETSVLEQATIDRADVVAAVTGLDEDNFIVCQIAKELFKVHRTIARVNDPDNERLFNELGVDVPIGATVILGKIIEEEASFADVVELFSFKRGKLSLIRVDLPETSPVINQRVLDLQLPPSSVLVSIMRADEIIIPKGDTVLKPMDDLIALTLVEHKQRLLKYLIGDI